MHNIPSPTLPILKICIFSLYFPFMLHHPNRFNICLYIIWVYPWKILFHCPLLSSFQAMLLSSFILLIFFFILYPAVVNICLWVRLYPGKMFIVVLYFYIYDFKFHKCCCILDWILFLTILLNSVFLRSVHFYVLLILITALFSMGVFHFLDF